MAPSRLRDRDAILTEEGLIFRVLGYSHPRGAYVCDLEYAPSDVFRSTEPRAFRTDGRSVFYKFYGDEGLRFVESLFPSYKIFHEGLRRSLVGVPYHRISEVRKPWEALGRLVEGSSKAKTKAKAKAKAKAKDGLLLALEEVLETVRDSSGLSVRDFGVFGSMLHGFYDVRFSDLDLVVYGRENTARLRKTLEGLYEERMPRLRNEFEDPRSVRGKKWRFQNYSLEEYVWHQRRKMVYALFPCGWLRRSVKVEFEPVKKWKEIGDEGLSGTETLRKGWVKMRALIEDDSDAPFLPSVYRIEPLRILRGPKEAQEAARIVSYLEEFRMQASKGEEVYVEGNLEEVRGREGSLHQITLTRCPRYYEQVLKVEKPSNTFPKARLHASATHS